MDKKFLKKVIAQSPSDLQYISACCSEAKTKIKDINFEPIESFKDPIKLRKEITQLEDQMYKFAKNLEFEEAATYRDRVEDLKLKLINS